MSSTNLLRPAELPGPQGSPADHERYECADRLAEVLYLESSLLSDLRAALRMQRQGVADDDVEAVGRSLQTMHRLVLVLAEAREQRRLVIGRLGVSSDLPLGALEAELGPWLTETARALILELQEKALVLAREIEGNRQILASALAENDAYARALCGEPWQSPVYAAGARDTTNKRHGGAILNQQV